jgi:hypothetical protein
VRQSGEPWLKIRGIIALLARRFRSIKRLELAWSGSAQLLPVIRYRPSGSEIFFSLSSVTDDTFAMLDVARRRRTPVRLRSLKQPLNLLITDVRRVGREIRVTGWIA